VKASLFDLHHGCIMAQMVNGPTLNDLGSTVGDAAIGHLDLAFRRMLGTGPGIEHAENYLRLITGKSHPFANFGMLGAKITDAEAKRALSAFDACSSAVVFFAGRRNEGLDAIAKDSGFGTIEPFPAMAVEIDRLAPTSLPEGYRFFRLGPGAALSSAWTVTFSSGFGFPLDIGESFRPRIERDDPQAPVQFFAVQRERDQEIVATSAVCLHDGVAGIYCVATLPEERKKGFGAHVTAEPLRIARDLGYRVGVLQASKEGKPVYERLGFGTYGDAILYMKAKD
jgi:GNAT superfamily N-acetyltransferase